MSREAASGTKLPALLFLCYALILGACGNDNLGYAPWEPPPPPPPPPKVVQEQPGPCPDGSARVNGTCPVAPRELGTIMGRVCDESTGTWLEGVTASVETPDGTLSDVTDNTGYFELANIPVGTYVIDLAGNGYSGLLNAQVFDGQPTEVGPTTCKPPVGILRGRVCDDLPGNWVAGATVLLNTGTSTTSDVNGRFEFYNILIGDYTVSIFGPNYTTTLQASVFEDQVTDLSPARCDPTVGILRGRVCDSLPGTWVPGANIVLDNGSSTLSDANGRYEFLDLLAGDYIITITSATVNTTEQATVTAGQVVDVSPVGCNATVGDLRGRVCDDQTGNWIAGAAVALDSGASTVSDANGRFEFLDVLAGSYVVTITSSAVNTTLPATVIAGQTSDISPPTCDPPPPGAVQGRICAGNYWLSGAEVRTTKPDGTSTTTTTDVTGTFLLTGLPPAAYTITVSKGSFSLTINTTVTSGNTTVLADPVCIPPTTYIAVVTGVYDQVEQVLGDLGFPVRDMYSSPTPTTLDPGGNVDLIYGHPSSAYWGDWAADSASYYWAEQFLTDTTWMAQYDIIFLNCGVNDWLITEGSSAVPTAAGNLAQFVNDGGSLYVSDWAGEIMELAFPSRINFIDDGTLFGNARWGIGNTTLAATVSNAGLEAALGKQNVTINLNFDYWVVMNTAVVQPASLNVLVVGNVQFRNFGPTASILTQNNTPLVVHFGHGDGRVLFTSAHLEAQTTTDLRDILNYMVFEL